MRKRVLVTGGAGFAPVRRAAEPGKRCHLSGQFLYRSERKYRGAYWGIPILSWYDTTSPSRTTSRSTKSTISPARRARFTISSIRCRRLRRVSTEQINVLGPAKRVKAKIPQASTSEVYGDPQVHPQLEDYWGRVNPIGLRSCYDEGKRCARSVVFDYWRQHKVQIKVARIFNTYGPRMRLDDGRVVSNFIRQALQGEDITLYGDSSQTRSFCYVSDLIEVLLRLMATPSEFTGPVNPGTPRECTIRELAEQIIQLTGSNSRIANAPLPADDPRQRRPDIALANRVLDWQPMISLRDGLQRTIEYFAAKRNA